MRSKFRFSPAWWPFLALIAPVGVPAMLLNSWRAAPRTAMARKVNQDAISHANALDLPELSFLEITPLVEWFTAPGFRRDSGVSYHIRTDAGEVLLDVGYGPTTPTLLKNAAALGFDPDRLDALVISHLHADHMGGVNAQKTRTVSVPNPLQPMAPIPCYLPEEATAPGFLPHVVTEPMLLPAGLGTTGPMERNLWFFGQVEEQALVARVKGKGTVLITGCGHPGIAPLLAMTGQLAPGPMAALCGGLHYPVTDGRGNMAGIRLQTFIGTGKPPWKRLTFADLDRAIDKIAEKECRQVLLSGHDSCDGAIARMTERLSDVAVLKAGETVRISA